MNTHPSQEAVHSTDNCYLTYSDELEGGGYLICTYNHEVGEECLLDDKEYENYCKNSPTTNHTGETKL